MAKILWEDMRWPEFEQLNKLKTIIIVPVASMEQHGPHLPVATDTKITNEIAIQTAKSLIGTADVLITPPVWTGFSPHHMDFPGTISLTTTAFINVLVDICQSIYYHGFKKIILLNGHGGNMPFTRIVSAEMRDKPDCQIAAVNYWDLAKESVKNLMQENIPGHSGEFETSLQLFLSKNLVDSFYFSKRSSQNYSRGSVKDRKRFYIYKPFKALTKNGELGHPELASETKGERIISIIVEELKNFVVEFSNS